MIFVGARPNKVTSALGVNLFERGVNINLYRQSPIARLN